MAVLRLESWIGLSTSHSSRKWSQASSAPISTQNGRFGSSSRALRLGNTGFGMTIANTATIIIGMAIKSNGIWGTRAIFWGRDAGSVQWTVTPNSSGYLDLRRSSDVGTIITTSTGAMPQDTWCYVEVKITTHGTTGAIVARINGVEVLNATSLDTNATANNFINEVGIGCVPGGNGNSIDITDIYIADTSGSSPNNDFLGDIRVEGLMPTSNGTTSQLTGSDGNSTDNYLLVDEDAPGADDDTTYVESSTVGQKDTYNYPSLSSTTGTVYAVQVSPMAKKTDAGTRSIRARARLSGTETTGATTPLSTDYAVLPGIFETKPGGGAWSISDVASAEFGVEVVE